ncbi:MAG: right-handed parallel beta-helix repeat-containing protein [Phycisphaerales bacterium JB039]
MRHAVTRNPRHAAMALIIAAAGAPAGAQTIWRVDLDATGAATGLSWDDAFTDLHAALAAAAAGDEIWVAAGLYTPSDYDATVSFMMASGVGLYGGFAGDEMARDERDPALHETILSGDIGRDDIVGSGPGWYVSWERGTPNSGHVIDASGAGPGTVIDGFTLADGATGPAGTPAGSSLMAGGGIYCALGTITVRNCVFRHHLAAFAHGGGMYLYDASATIEACQFLENYAHLGNGAGLAVYGDSEVTVTGSVFARNIAVHGSGGGEGHGAGAAIQRALSAVIEDCVFDQNTSKYFYAVGGLEPLYGGGLHCFLSPLTVRNSAFTRNTAAAGGGAYVFGSASFEGCLFAGNTARAQPNDPYPELGGFAGGLGATATTGHTLETFNCTIEGNTAKKYGGLYTSGALVVENAVIWGNTATDPDFVGYWAAQVSSTFDTIGYSCVQDLFGPKKAGEDPLEPEKRPGCIESDPQFAGPVDPADPATYALAPGSPCIDAARNSMVPAGLVVDLAGMARFADDPATPDTGVGAAPIVDMGALEFHPDVACRVDLDGDGALTIFDFLEFQNLFAVGDLRADFTGDGVLDFFDFLAFQNEFAAGCP